MQRLKTEQIHNLIEKSIFWNNNQFTGTENYYKHGFFPVVYTDGVKSCLQENHCYWSMDVISSYYNKLRRIDDGLFVFYFIVKDNNCLFIADNGDGNIRLKQYIPYTDLKKGLKFYGQFDHNGKLIVCLPSEY